MIADSTTPAVRAAIARSPVIGVVRTDSSRLAREQAERMIDAGLELIEITFTVPDAVDLTADLLARRSGDGPPWVGMGSATDRRRAERAVAVGADFVVSPNVSRPVAEVVRAAGRFLILGALTPTEIVEASRVGADLVKVYPLPAVGGTRYLETVRGPLGDIDMLAAGGFGVEEIADYRAAGASAFGMPAPLLLDGDRSIERALDLARGERR